MLNPVIFMIVPGVTVVAAGIRTEEILGEQDEMLELIVLGETIACLDAVVAHSGSLARQLVGRPIAAEDVFTHSEVAPGVCRFVLG